MNPVRRLQPGVPIDDQQILTEQRGDVLLLTLDRPERLNAWTPRMMAQLTDAVSTANAYATAEPHGAVAAFLGKRPPTFR